MIFPRCFVLACVSVLGVRGMDSCEVGSTCASNDGVAEENSLMQIARQARAVAGDALQCADGSDCVVKEGETKVLSASLDVKSMSVYGTLQWDTSKDGLELKTGYVLVRGMRARFEVGTEESPMELKATIFIKNSTKFRSPAAEVPVPDDNATDLHICGYQFVCGAEGSHIGIHGRKMNKTWSLLSRTATAGATSVYLKDDAAAMGWRDGDQIAIATTSRGESYLGRIKSISGSNLHLSSPLQDKHLGGVIQYKGKSFEMAAEVMNLDRSVVITGDADEFPKGEYDRALHIIQSETGVLQVSYTRVEYCGQRNRGGRYCLHWHLLKQCPTCFFTGNTIYESNQIGLAVHGVHGTTSDWNTLWNSRAVGIYTEDGNEMHNNMRNNAMICSNLKECDIGWREFNSRSGAGVGGFYLIAPNQNLINNHVVSHPNGAWFNSAERASGSHGNPNVFGHACPTHFSLGKVQGNVFHDNDRFGMYLDQQYPRDVDIDPVEGLLLNNASCNAYKSDGSGNGVDSANLVEDHFDYNNENSGQEKTGDIRFVRYTSVDNVNSMFWLEGKNFKDGGVYHIEDSVFVGLPQGMGGLKVAPGVNLLLPGGAFTFGMRNVSILGGPTRQGALKLNNNCGQAGSPCTTQYLLDHVTFDLEPANEPRVGLYPYPSTHPEAISSILITRDGDDSLDGHRSIVSNYLNGFAGVKECQKLGDEWHGMYGCSVPVRRLNVYPLGSTRNSFPEWNGHMTDLELSGPGYNVTGSSDMPTRNQNAGHMVYSAKYKGYGLPVIAGRNYTLKVTSQIGSPVYEFSDVNLNKALGVDEDLFLTVTGGDSPLNCTLRGLAARPFMNVPGYVEGNVKPGCLD